jgi:serine/threonine protein kinase
MMKREVVLKKEVSFNSEFQLLSKQEKKDKKGRVEHEMDILNIMVGARPIFLPKYYIPVNKNVIFPKSLLMDYIPTKTLAEFLKSYDASLSLQTKLSYMFSIAQSMRYLREFNVVHLDLKPSNILMYHNMLVKIIDFGESYHPDICDKDFCPGFTVPYSCPELYSDHRSYTSKADIFSIGVIFYEMLYSRCPFDIHVNTTRIDQEMSKYSELWYFSPEEYESYGESEVLRLLNVLISRCLAV